MVKMTQGVRMVKVVERRAESADDVVDGEKVEIVRNLGQTTTWTAVEVFYHCHYHHLRRRFGNRINEVDPELASHLLPTSSICLGKSCCCCTAGFDFGGGGVVCLLYYLVVPLETPRQAPAYHWRWGRQLYSNVSCSQAQGKTVET